MADYSGSALVVQWTHTGGTISLQADFQNFSYAPSVDLYEVSAGADTAKSYLPGLKSGNCTFTGIDQAGSWATFGSLLKEGVVGTVIYKPEGVGAGKLGGTIPAICMGVTYNQPYNNFVEISVSWTQNGARTEGTLSA